MPAGTFATTDIPALICPAGWQDAVLLLDAEGSRERSAFRM
jgi:hypothetical protein